MAEDNFKKYVKAASIKAAKDNCLICEFKRKCPARFFNRWRQG